MRVADWIAEQLLTLGVSHVFGVGGANIEDVCAAVQRRRPRLRMVLGKHEHAAGTAADACARLGGGLGVVVATSGGGTLNLVHALAEARASRVPVLALLGEPPSELQGRGAFQDSSGRGDAIDGAAVLAPVSVSCARAQHAEDVPRLLDAAITSALVERGPAVLLLAKDLQCAELGGWPSVAPPPPRPRPASEELLGRARHLLRARPVVVLAGAEVARQDARAELRALVEQLDARVAVTPDARDVFDTDDARWLGVAGALGHGVVAEALRQAALCVVVGTRLPLIARQGLEASLREKPTLSLGPEAPHLLSAAGHLHVAGDVRACLAALAAPAPGALASRSPRAGTPPPATSARRNDAEPLTATTAMALLGRALPERSVVIVDAGNTGALATHLVPAPRDGRWLIALGMAGMGYAFGAAIGAACATGRRCTVIAGDGAFYMNGLDVHTAVEHQLPITYVVFDNRAHGMCLVRERLLLADHAGYNAFSTPVHLGAGLAAMWPRLDARDVATPAELTRALAEAYARPGPSFIAVSLPEVEIPPHAAFAQALAQGLRTVAREHS